MTRLPNSNHKLTSMERTTENTVTATFRDVNFSATTTIIINREDLAKLVRVLAPDSRFGTGMEPDTNMVDAASAYLGVVVGYPAMLVQSMSMWQRVWSAEAGGWDRRAWEVADFLKN